MRCSRRAGKSCHLLRIIIELELAPIDRYPRSVRAENNLCPFPLPPDHVHLLLKRFNHKLQPPALRNGGDGLPYCRADMVYLHLFAGERFEFIVLEFIVGVWLLYWV